jgi:hypothetical protein
MKKRVSRKPTKKGAPTYKNIVFRVMSFRVMSINLEKTSVDINIDNKHKGSVRKTLNFV